MSTYEPGTLAVATVRGVEGVRVFRRLDHRDQPRWEADRNILGWLGHADEDVTDIRPLVVLDLDAIPSTLKEPTAAAYAARALREDANGYGHTLRAIADQIEAQTKPTRIPEPGLWGVVEASFDRDDDGVRQPFVRHPGGWESVWWNEIEWDDLIDPTLIREGVES